MYDETKIRTRQTQVLRPTPGDPWGVEQHHWKTGANEIQQLNPVGQATDKKISGPIQLK